LRQGKIQMKPPVCGNVNSLFNSYHRISISDKG
jgi:hypothetical protein